METYPYYVQLARDITNELLREWQQAPFRWEREIDIQSELHGRLSAAFQLTGKSVVTYNGLWKVARVAAEPTVYYDVEGAGNCWCHPDIVIRDDQGESPPTFGYWPLIWVCELKYDPNDKAVWTDADAAKIRALIKQNKTRYGWGAITLVASGPREGSGFGKKGILRR